MGVAFALIVAGCATSMDELREHVEADLTFDCSPTNKIVVTPIDDRTATVAGCGNEATYVRVCSRGSGKLRCEWLQITRFRRRWEGHPEPEDQNR